MTLSIAEAKEQGYKYCGYADKDWQSLINLDDADKEDLEKGKLVLFSKESNSPAISHDDLIELIAEHVEVNWSDECQDDTEAAYHAVKSVNIQEASDKINEALSSIKAYGLTDIVLVP